VEEAYGYAAKSKGKLVLLDAGHFAMLVRSEQTNRAIHDFVEARLTARASR
jgi:hypothetical protein